MVSAPNNIEERITLPQLAVRDNKNLDFLRRRFRHPSLAGFFEVIGDRRFIRVSDLPRIRELLSTKVEAVHG
jgi:hypothetical protein